MSNPSYTDPIQLVGGDDFLEPFLIEDPFGNIADLTASVVTGAILWPGNEVDISSSGGVQVTNLHPPQASGSGLQTPHGFIQLTEAQTLALPKGAPALLRLTVTTGGSKTSTFLKRLDRI